MEKYYILKEKKPIICKRMDWIKWFGKADRTVKDTFIGDANISTVFIGVDDLDDVFPMVFQTAVYKCDADFDTIRYSAWEHAVSGHNQMVEKVKKWKNNLRKFKLINEVKKDRGILKFVEPLEPITYREVYLLTSRKAMILIDDKQFTVLDCKKDFLPFKLDEEFRFMGKKLISFLVKNNNNLKV